jgi:hypothetical protein
MIYLSELEGSFFDILDDELVVDLGFLVSNVNL